MHRISKFRYPFGKLAKLALLRVPVGAEPVLGAAAALRGGSGKEEPTDPRF